MWWTALALAEPPPCEASVAADVAELAEALREVEGDLRPLVPDLPPLDATPWAFARDDGTWLAVGTHFPTTCLADGVEVAARRLWAMPGSGSMSLFTGTDEARPILAVGTHDEARDGWDRIGWKAIIAHEWQHVAHAYALGDAFPGLKERRALTRRFLKKQEVRDAVVAWGTALKADCSDAPTAAHLRATAALPRRWRSALEAYVAVEGFARYAEVRYELDQRRIEATDEAVVQGCSPMEHGEFGYALGCLVAAWVDRCRPGLDRTFHTDIARWLGEPPGPPSPPDAPSPVEVAREALAALGEALYDPDDLSGAWSVDPAESGFASQVQRRRVAPGSYEVDLTLQLYDTGEPWLWFEGRAVEVFGPQHLCMRWQHAEVLRVADGYEPRADEVVPHLSVAALDAAPCQGVTERTPDRLHLDNGSPYVEHRGVAPPPP